MPCERLTIEEPCRGAALLSRMDSMWPGRLRSNCRRILSSSSLIGRTGLNGQHFQQSSMIRLKFAGWRGSRIESEFDQRFSGAVHLPSPFWKNRNAVSERSLGARSAPQELRLQNTSTLKGLQTSLLCRWNPFRVRLISVGLPGVARLRR